MKIGILGAGIMGHSIALSFALSNFETALYDISEEGLNTAKEKINKHLDIMHEMDALASHVANESVLSHIHFTTDLSETVKDAGLIIEAVPEKIEIKKDLYGKLNDLVDSETIVASNTSTFSLDKLSELYHNKEKLCITHYFNPGHIVPLVEVVQKDMGEADVQTVKSTLEQCGKEVIVLKKDIDGFIANRLQAALLREALSLVEKGVAEPEDIDKAIKSGPGLRWSLNGPIEIADFGGLDTWNSVLKNLQPLLDESTTPSRLLVEKYEAGELGTKTNKGFYDYSTVDLKDAEENRERKLIEVMKVKRK